MRRAGRTSTRAVPIALCLVVLSLAAPDLGGLRAAGPAAPAAQEVGQVVTRRGTVADNLYVAGERVEILAQVEGDVVAAGGRVTLGERVKGDVLVAGGSVSIGGDVLDDVRAAGGDLAFSGRVGGDVMAAGGRVALGPQARVLGKAWLAGGEVEVGGHVGRELRVAAGTVRLAGEVAGDVVVTAREVLVLPTARIRGALTYWSPGPARVDPAARVEGAVRHHQMDAVAGFRGTARAVWRVVRVLVLASLALIGIVLVLALPGGMVAAARTVGSDPWKSLGLGLLSIVATPVAGLVLAVTILGLPLALTLGAFYVAALGLGVLTAALFLGDLGVRLVRRGTEPSRAWGVLALLVGLVGLGLLRAIPVVGIVLVVLAAVLGMGAALLELYRSVTGPRPAQRVT